LHIANYGYIFEHSAAFFPLFPFTIRVFSQYVLALIFDFNESIFLLSACILNFIFFNIANIYLFKLTLKLFKENNVLAFYTCLFFSLNPGNIFFSAAYSESLYSMLTFSALYYLYSSHIILSLFLFVLSGLTRSNGILNTGFLIHFLIRNHFMSIKLISNNFIKLFKQFLRNILSFKLIISTILIFICMISSFLSFQLYIYLTFCVINQTFYSEIPKEFIKYAKQNEYTILADKSISWCNNTIPLSYNHIQSAYWNNGFLKYWKFKQIPNFILASPLVFVCFKALKHYFESMDHKNGFNLFGLINAKKTNQFKTFQHNSYMYPFAVHLIFLLVSALFFMHVQVFL